MSGWDDLHGVTPPRISPEDAERLLSNASGADASHELAEIKAVFDALRGPAEPVELEGLHSALVAFGAAVVNTQLDPSTARTRPMIRKLLTGKAIATIGVVTLISAGAAAAAGVMPTPFSASRPLATTSSEHEADDNSDSTDETVAGDTTPSTDEAEATEPVATVAVAAAATVADEATVADDSTDSTDGVGPDVNGPAKFGLCTAFETRRKHDSTTTTVATATPVAEPVANSDLPVPFQALSDAAAAAGQTVADFCADAVPGGSGDDPSSPAPGKSGDNPSATAPGKPGDNPSVTAPGKPDSNPSATAPGKPVNPGGGHGKP